MGCLFSAAAARRAALFPGAREEYAASGQPDGHLRGSELTVADYSGSEAKDSLPLLIREAEAGQEERVTRRGFAGGRAAQRTPQVLGAGVPWYRARPRSARPRRRPWIKAGPWGSVVLFGSLAKSQRC